MSLAVPILIISFTGKHIDTCWKLHLNCLLNTLRFLLVVYSEEQRWYRVTHGNLTAFDGVVLSRSAGGGRGVRCQCVVFVKMVPQRTLQTSQ
jgi:hypothetical protein